MRKLTAPVTLAAALLASAPIICSGANVAAAAGPSCNLKSANSQIKHVVYVQFDNLHLNRDNPNVPSDLEFIPSLLNFLQSNGTVMSNHHTGLISHTATGILSSLTGLYGDRMGVPVSNSFLTYKQDGTVAFPSSFAYWTAKVLDSTQFNQTPNMLNELGVTAAAPWVAYTRAGCDVGMVSTANTVFENVNKNPTGDITTVFGNPSPEFTETSTNPTLALADFEGIAIHCTVGSSLCGASPNAKPDLLPTEAGGYKGYKALFGHKYVAQQISPNGPIKDINGNTIQDSHGNAGFPGFDGMSAAVSLGYVATLLEHNIPVVYAYISDAHDNHAGGGTFGPGEAGYVAQLKSYDSAFTAFFSRLAEDGIDQTNTLFVFTADEGDHFVGANLTNCDGVVTPCVYNHSGPNINIGEINVNLPRLLLTEKANATAFDYHFDSAPAVYVFGTPGPVIPGQTDPKVRQLERDIGGLTVLNPLRGTTDTLTQAMVDHAAMQTLHMLTKDPLRTPNFVMFANADYFFQTSGQTTVCNPISQCVVENPNFAWNHGDVQNEIAQTWLGIAGPGIAARGRDNATWSDHVDIRPTILALTGLRDTYIHDGRVLVEALDPNALPASLASSMTAYANLGVAFKRINAAFQDLGQATLKISTKGLLSGNAQDDSQYTNTETLITTMTATRDALASQMKALLNGTAFKGASLSPGQAQGFIDQANALVAQAQAAAGP